MNYPKYVAPTPVKSTAELVEEIHLAFNTEGDRLLKEALQVLALDTSTKIQVADRLFKVGFRRTRAAQEGRELYEKMVESKELSDLIRDYSIRYPQNRFITEDGVTRICDKYNLICGPVEKYIGEVPDRNLKEIEDFRIECGDGRSFRGQYPLSICAPQHDFDTRDMVIKDRRLSQVIPDPVVLHAIKGGYLIVSAWGPEAKDSEVISERKN